MRQPAVIRHETVGRIFRGYPTLNRKAACRDFGWIAQPDLGIAQGRAFGDQNLRFDNVVARDHLGDGVFNLNARIHFYEEKLAAVGIHQKLNGACVIELNGPPHRQSGVENLLPRRFRQVLGRSNFNDLLMSALEGTIPFKQMHQAAVLIPDKLNFDVSSSADIFFKEHIGDAKRLPRFAPGLIQSRLQLIGREDGPASLDRHRPWRP